MAAMKTRRKMLKFEDNVDGTVAKAHEQKDNLTAKQNDRTKPPSLRIRIQIRWAQILAAFAFTFNIRWPESYGDFLTLLYRYINVDFVDVFGKMPGVGCQLGSDFFLRFLGTMATPLLLIVIGGLAVLVLVTQNRTTQGTAQVISKAKDRLAQLFVQGVLFLYPGLCSKIFTMFSCVEISDQRYLKADMLEVCHEGRHVAYTQCAIVGLAVYAVGVPLCFFFALHKNRDDILSRETRGDQLELKNPSWYKAVEHLHLSYRPHVWWFDVVEMGRQLLLTGALVVLHDSPTVQLLVGNIVNLAYLCVFLAYKPMVNFTDYLAQYAASLHLTLTLLVGLWIQLARIHPYSKGQTAFYTDALGGAVLFSVFLVPIIFQIVDPTLASWFASEPEDDTWKRKYFGRYHKWATSFERKHHYTPHKAVVDKDAVVLVDKAAAVVSLDVILEGEGECGGSSRLEPRRKRFDVVAKPQLGPKKVLI
jgi:hypothetical protein